MTTRTDRFQRKPGDKKENVPLPDEPEEVIRFSPEEEAVCAALEMLPACS